MKKFFEAPVVELIELGSDIIVTSPVITCPNELPEIGI
jgi:hypothetical protein